jgi:hypothetical protein
MDQRIILYSYHTIFHNTSLLQLPAEVLLVIPLHLYYGPTNRKRLRLNKFHKRTEAY